MSTNLYQDVTEQIKSDALALMTDARHASLASLEVSDGHPLCTRVGFGTINDAKPLIFVSALSPHTKALLGDPRCSLLLGQVERGDPLTNPRLTLQGNAEPISRAESLQLGLRQTWLQQHPKSKLYIDLPDFMFIQLHAVRATFIAGFGKAYEMPVEIFAAKT